MPTTAKCFSVSPRTLSVPRWVMAFLFYFAFLTACPAQAADDVVLYHGKVFTGEPEHPYAEAVAIRGDKIVAVGNRGDVSKAVARDTKVSWTVVGGKTVYGAQP